VIILAVPIAAQGTIVIVSDSDCDVAMAELLASVMEAKIVKVEWGFFDEEAIAEVVESEPDNIIIIGGTKAVVDQIQEVLETMGFSIFRVAGEDRKETSLQLYRTFREYFSDDFAVVVVDMHRASISKGKRLAIRNSVPLFFCDVSELEDMLKEINELGIEEIRIITRNRQDDLRTTCEKRLKEAQNRFESIEVTELNEEVVQECATLLEEAVEAFENGNYLLCLEYLVDLENLLNELEE
jgi:putative cell wall-binding protein